MKKIIRLSLVLVLILSLGMQLVSCIGVWDENGGSSGGGPKEPQEKTVTVTLVNALGSEDIVATCDKELKVSQPTKSGYYFVGYYDSEVGGTCYIDGLGTSNSVWQESFPKKLYAQWKSISGMSYDSEVDNADKAYEFGFYSKTYFYRLPDEFKSAIRGNLNENMNVTVHFKAKEVPKGISSYAPVTVKLRDGNDEGAITVGKTTLTPPNEYKSYDLNFSVKAGDFSNGIVYVIFDLGYANTSLYLRNISVSVSFD